MGRKIVSLLSVFIGFSRPSKIDEISHQPEVVSALRKSVSSGKVVFK